MQADRTLDRADSGIGVGLTLVKSLIELHGGEITVHSDGEGKGSDFCIRLPTCDPPVPSKLTDGQEEAGHQIRTLVLVEDNLDASRMLTFLLEDAGYEVSVAHDGRRGLELIQNKHPDAAIVDLGLPELDGYEVARKLRADASFEDMYLIALTGYGQETDRTDARNAGFDEHFVKPLDPELLNRVLRDLPPRNRSKESLRHDRPETRPGSWHTTANSSSSAGKSATSPS